MNVRALTHADIPQAMRLVEAAGWNQTAEDWARFIDLSGEACFGVEEEGVLAATGGAALYGRRLAWVGMVLTLPEFRGRGIASRILIHTLQELDRLGIECVKLDATDFGHDLYRKLGFEDECVIERYVGQVSGLPRSAVDNYAPDPALDLEAFGAGRSELLRRLAVHQTASVEGGFAMGRPGRVSAYFGPCVARTPEAARHLLTWFLARHPNEPIAWDLLPGNAQAVKLARDFGFEPRRRLMRMTRGAPAVQSNSALVYAAAAFELG
ncbi:MAG: GNAT family N-acetyltransferase [Bryobacteraceae bacterium]